jgi:hypothetical protein
LLGHAKVATDVIIFTVLVWRSAILNIFVTDQIPLAIIMFGAKITAIGSGLGFASKFIVFRFTREAMQFICISAGGIG